MNHSHAIDWFDGGFFVALIFIDCSGFIERTISLSVSWELCGFICLQFCCLLQRHYIPIEQRTVHTATTVLCSLSIFNGIKTERERESGYMFMHQLKYLNLKAYAIPACAIAEPLDLRFSICTENFPCWRWFHLIFSTSLISTVFTLTMWK